VTFFNRNKKRLTHLGTEDNEFFLKVLYTVDTAKEAYLHDWCNGSINPSLINFASTRSQILSHQFYISLPQVLQALTTSCTTTPHNSTPTKPPPKAGPVTNKHSNQNLLVSMANYKTLIHNNVKNGHAQPQMWDKSTKKLACMRWHLKQICTSDCPHAAAHTAFPIHYKVDRASSCSLQEMIKEKELLSPGKQQQYPGKQFRLRQQVGLLPSNHPIHQTSQTQLAFPPCQLITPSKDSTLKNNPFAPLATEHNKTNDTAHSLLTTKPTSQSKSHTNTWTHHYPTNSPQ
jgi:hypothetical protein